MLFNYIIKSLNLSLLTLFILNLELNYSKGQFIESRQDKVNELQKLMKNDVVGSPLTKEDFDKASKTELDAFIQQNGKTDPIELAGLFQGDIVLTPDQELIISGGNIRNAIINQNKKWPDNTIPYLISSAFNNQERATIAVAIFTLQNNTCIRLVPRSNEEDYVHLIKGRGCSSLVGRSGGPQTISLGLGCLIPGIVMHELMHATGFWHEHSRYDRESYITIIWKNIKTGRDGNFKKYDWTAISSLGYRYDLGSIMHYGAYAFAKDRTKPTIIPRRRVEIGQRREFSERDIEKINTLYQCPGFGGDEELDCIDNNKHCGAWAALGECKTNPKWMLSYCKSSCKVCGHFDESCADGHIYCSQWAKSGECRKNPNYMLVNCQFSCRSCVPAYNEPNIFNDTTT